MRRPRRCLPLLALLICINSKLSVALPVREDELDTSTRLLGSSVVTSVSVVTDDGDSSNTYQADSRKAPSTQDLPQSPANLFTPDRFQFYTYNDRGDMITRQMTEQEIQSLIAAGGGHSPMDEPQKDEDMITGGKKVADVVQKVQNVLKSAMDRPTTVMSSIPTIPGHANDEWSSILPAILSGDVGASEPANIPETKPETSTIHAMKPLPTFSDLKESQSTTEKRPAVLESSGTAKPETPSGSENQETSAGGAEKKPEVVQGSRPDPVKEEESEKYPEKPMVPVPVITIDQKPTTQRPDTEDSPMYQILNIIPAENASKEQNDTTKTVPRPQNMGGSAVHGPVSVSADRIDQTTVTPEVYHESSTKLPGFVKDQLPTSTESHDMVQLHIITDDKPSEENRDRYSTMSTNAADSSTFVTMSVISETHSTSMKVPGQPEIPLQQFHVVPGMKPEHSVDHVKVPETTPLASIEDHSTIVTSSIPIDLEKVTSVSESEPETVTQKIMEPEVVRVTLKDPPSADVSFVTTEASPSTIGISSDYNQTPIDSYDIPVKPPAEDNVKINSAEQTSRPLATLVPENVEDKVHMETATEKIKTSEPPVQEVSTLTPVKEKPVFQILPEIKPENDHSESTAIEQIIETLNQKIEDEPSTHGTQMFSDGMKFNTAQLVESQSTESPSTFAPSSTSVKMDAQTTVESKPLETFPTELANSLTSMINQVSDAVPSILPVSPSGSSEEPMMKTDGYVKNQGTTLKPTTLKAIDEPTPMKIDEIIQNNPISGEMEEPANRVNLPLNAEFSSSEDGNMKMPDIDDSEATIVFEPNPKETEEEDIQLTIDNFNLDSDKVRPETSTVKAEQESDVLVNKNELPSEAVPAPSSLPTESAETATTNEDLKTAGVNVESTTAKTITVEMSTNSKTDAVTAEPVKLEDQPSLEHNLSSTQPDITPISQKPEVIKTEVPGAVEISTETPQVIKDEITPAAANKVQDEEKHESVSTETKSDESIKIEPDAESSLVKIKLTDSASLVNAMLHTAMVPSSTPPVEPINLPENLDKIKVNNLASGLIAGFQSTTEKSEVKVATSPSPATNTSDDIKVTKGTESSETVADSQEIDTKSKPSGEKVEADKNIQVNDSLSGMAVMENVDENTSEFVKVEMVTEDVPAEENAELSGNDEIIMKVKNDTKDNIDSSLVAQSEEKVPSKTQEEESKVTSSATVNVAPEDDKNETENVKENTMSDANQTNESTTEGIKVSPENSLTDALPVKSPSEEINKEKLDEVSVQNSETTNEGEMKDQVMVESNTSTNTEDKVEIKNENLNKEQSIVNAEENKESVTSSNNTAESDEFESNGNVTKTEDEENAEEVTVKPETQTTVPLVNGSPESIVSSVEENSSGVTKKPTKPELPVVRIDISPEAIQEELPSKIQLTDLPIIDKIPLSNIMKSPSTTEKSEVIRDNTTENVSIASNETQENVENSPIAVDNKEDIVGSMTGESPIKMEAPLTRVELLDRPTTESHNTEKKDNPEVLVDSSSIKPPTTLIEIVQPPQSTLALTTERDTLEESTTQVYVNKHVITEDHQQKIQEIRIQVNDTAVLVTKHPLPDTYLSESSTSEKSPSEKVEMSSTDVTDKNDTKKDVDTVTEQAVTPAFVKIETETVKSVEDNVPTTEKLAPITVTSYVKNENASTVSVRVDETETSTIKIDILPIEQGTTEKIALTQNTPVSEKDVGSDNKKEDHNDANVPQVPNNEDVPQVSNNADVPQVHDAADVQQVSSNVDVPQVPNSADVPQVSNNADVPQVHDDADVPQVPSSADVQQVSSNVDVPQVPNSADVPQVPNSADVQVPNSADAPQVPNNADVQQVSNSADVQQVPNSAEVPQVPNNADVQQVPNNADVSQVSNNADVQQVPNSADVQQVPNNVGSTVVKDTPVESPQNDKINIDTLKQNVTANDEVKLQIPNVTTAQPVEQDTTQKMDLTTSHGTTSLPQQIVTKQPPKVENIPTPQAMYQSVPEKVNAHVSGSNQNPPESGNKKPVPETPTDHKWTLIPQQIPTNPHPPKRPASKPLKKPEIVQTTTVRYPEEPQQKPIPLDASQTVNGLDASVKDTSNDIVSFSKLCNELAFSFWMATNKGLSTGRSLALSPFGMTSLLAMIFLGARGPTSEQMNELLRLDDVATFNPHLVFQNVTDAVGLARNQGIANAAFVRELFADKSKVRKLMPFYKDQAQQFYEALVTEVNFAAISDLVRRRTNLLIRKQTGGRIKDFVKTNTVPLRSPLAAMSANVFQTDCNSSMASSEGRDGELYFAVSPAVRQRKLVPVPATVWRAGVLAGYEPSLDATAVALGGTEKLVSTIFVIPGQQGHSAPGDTLDRLEQRLVRGAFPDGAWDKLLKVLIPRPGLELQIPKFSHRSVVNATAALKRMGLDELFSKHADLKGINGIGNHLHLADVLQMNLFSTCGDENIQSGRHHVEIYPSSSLRNSRHYESEQLSVEGLDEVETKTEEETSSYEDLTSTEGDYHEEEPEEENVERVKRDTSQERPRLKLDRPFLYFVRHNPTGLILHMGRFNPRLLP